MSFYIAANREYLTKTQIIPFFSSFISSTIRGE